MKFITFIVGLSTAAAHKSYFEEMIGVDQLRVWESQGRPSMLNRECGIDPTAHPALQAYMPGLEYMLQAAVYLPERKIGGTTADLCQFANDIATRPVETQGSVSRFELEKVEDVFRFLWHNQLAEHFAALGPYSLEGNYDVAVESSPEDPIDSLARKMYLQSRAFLNITDHSMPESAELRFFEFVAEASESFDFDKVWTIWKTIDPFNQEWFLPKLVILDEPRCAVGGIDPPRLSPQRTAWKKIKRLSDARHTWTEEETHLFCSIVAEYDQGILQDPSLKKFHLIEKKLDEFEPPLLEINRVIPHIKRLCGVRITRVLDIGFAMWIDNIMDAMNSDAIDTASIKGCSVIHQWNSGEDLSKDEITRRLFAAADA